MKAGKDVDGRVGKRTSVNQIPLSGGRQGKPACRYWGERLVIRDSTLGEDPC